MSLPRPFSFINRMSRHFKPALIRHFVCTEGLRVLANGNKATFSCVPDVAPP